MKFNPKHIAVYEAGSNPKKWSNDSSRQKGVPLYLYCATAVDNINSKTDVSSFNKQIPLAVTPAN